MNDRETFLARWSRRKTAAAAETARAEFPAMPAAGKPETPVEGWDQGERTAGDEGAPANDAPSAARGADAVVPSFDPASLPSIEAIAADTDIRAFLAPGVPPELARAALRRAWAADPKIRDFVGLADYDWDFNAPGSMAGFGPLEMTEELRQIAARIIGQAPVAAPAAATRSESSAPSERIDSRGETPTLVQKMTEQEENVTDRLSETDPRSESDPRIAAAQNQSDASERSRLVVRPRHGGALPK